MSAGAYLKTLKFSTQESNEQLERIEDFHSKRLWHQVTTELLTFVKRADVQSNLIEFHKKFIMDIEQRLNPLSLVEIVIFVLKNMKSMDDAIVLLDKLNETISSHKVASRLIQVTKGQIILENKSDEESLRKVRAIVKQLSPELEKEDGVSPVHSRFYEMAAQYYAKQSNHELFYRNTLRYLGCREDLDNFGPDFIDCGFKLCLAALLADNVYNFGELLQHKVLDAVRASEHLWIVQLLEAFNSGNIKKVEELKTNWQAQADLNAHQTKLQEKLMLSAVMECIFARAAKDRKLSFETIKEITGLATDKIEWLIMRGLSLGLMKGYLDQFDQSATFTWVQPRVLKKDQVGKMGVRVESWVKEVKDMESVIHQRSREMVQF